jgi:hypothetical protein
MPVYVLHGFRWSRRSIRHHIILNNIDDGAPEYIVAPKTSAALLESLRGLYPKLLEALPTLRFVEQYDPADMSTLSQPYAFVADKVEVCQLSLDLSEVMGRGVATEGWEALLELRDQIAPGEKVSWWVVYNGDEKREFNDEIGNEVSRSGSLPLVRAC